MQPAAAFVDMLREIPKSIKDFLLNKALKLAKTSKKQHQADEVVGTLNKHGCKPEVFFVFKKLD